MKNWKEPVDEKTTENVITYLDFAQWVKGLLKLHKWLTNSSLFKNEFLSDSRRLGFRSMAVKLPLDNGVYIKFVSFINLNTLADEVFGGLAFLKAWKI